MRRIVSLIPVALGLSFVLVALPSANAAPSKGKLQTQEQKAKTKQRKAESAAEKKYRKTKDPANEKYLKTAEKANKKLTAVQAKQNKAKVTADKKHTTKLEKTHANFHETSKRVRDMEAKYGKGSKQLRKAEANNEAAFKKTAKVMEASIRKENARDAKKDAARVKRDKKEEAASTKYQKKKLAAVEKRGKAQDKAQQKYDKKKLSIGKTWIKARYSGLPPGAPAPPPSPVMGNLPPRPVTRNPSDQRALFIPGVGTTPPPPGTSRSSNGREINYSALPPSP